MDVRTDRITLPAHGPVERVLLDGRWVGFVYPNREMPGLWWAHTDWGSGAETRDQAIAEVLRRAAADPTFEVQ